VASALANIGIRTRFVDAPEHIFVLADCELDEGERFKQALRPDLFVPIDGRLWIPIETTRLSEGFESAWASGAEIWSGLDSGRRSSTVDVNAAAQAYPAIEPAEDPVLPAIASDSLEIRLARTRRVVGEWEETRIDSLRSVMRDGSRTPDGLNAAAGVCFRAGRLQDAQDLLALGLRQAPDSPSLLANQAAIALRQGHYAEAEAAYRRIADAQAKDPDPCINLSLLYAALGDSAQARQWMSVAVARAGERGAVSAKLRLRAPRPGVRSALRTREEGALDDLLKSGAERPSLLLPGVGAPPLDGLRGDSVTRDALLARLLWAEPRAVAGTPR
jgi:tetratricopeptide (TPR) repeat protein